MNIYVGNMAYSMTEDELRDLFSNYGTVSSARLVTDRDTGRAKGFGFVEMADANEANAAIEAINGTKQGGRELVVNEARPRRRFRRRQPRLRRRSSLLIAVPRNPKNLRYFRVRRFFLFFFTS